MDTKATRKQRIKELQLQIKALQAKLEKAKKLEGIDPNVEVEVRKNQGRLERVKARGTEDKLFGRFYMEVAVTAEAGEVFVPLSIASGKKTAGFMYQIEGTGASSIVTAELKVRGAAITQITLGTLLFAKIPAGKTAVFEIRAKTNGLAHKSYQIVITRLNYKLNITQARYNQYLKPIPSKSVQF
jgi:hypothetical protein